MNRRRFDLLVCLWLGCLIGYFIWHAVYGQRSFEQADRLTARLEALTAERDRVRAERVALDRRVGLLRPDSIDPDMVEELARGDLGFVRPGDLVIPLDR